MGFGKFAKRSFFFPMLPVLLPPSSICFTSQPFIMPPHLCHLSYLAPSNNVGENSGHSHCRQHVVVLLIRWKNRWRSCPRVHR